MAIIAPIAAVIGLVGGYYALPASWQMATKADVLEVAGDVENSKVCILRLENRRLQIELETATDPSYRAYLSDQIAANTRQLEELAKRGARCAG